MLKKKLYYIFLLTILRLTIRFSNKLALLNTDFKAFSMKSRLPFLTILRFSRPARDTRLPGRALKDYLFTAICVLPANSAPKLLDVGSQN